MFDNREPLEILVLLKFHPGIGIVRGNCMLVTLKGERVECFSTVLELSGPLSTYKYPFFKFVFFFFSFVHAVIFLRQSFDCAWC